MPQLQSALGVFALLAFAWAISENHRAVNFRSAGIALLVTLVTAVLLLKVPQIALLFTGIARAVDAADSLVPDHFDVESANRRAVVRTD